MFHTFSDNPTKTGAAAPTISMLSGKLLRRGLQRAVRAPQQVRSFRVAAEKVEDDIPAASCRREADGRRFIINGGAGESERETDGVVCSGLLEVPPRDGLLLVLLQGMQRHPAHQQGLPLRLLRDVQNVRVPRTSGSFFGGYWRVADSVGWCACSPKHFNLEQRSIEKTYWNLQKRLHPDLYGSKSEVRATQSHQVIGGVWTNSFVSVLCSLRRNCLRLTPRSSTMRTKC